MLHTMGKPSIFLIMTVIFFSCKSEDGEKKSKYEVVQLSQTVTENHTSSRIATKNGESTDLDTITLYESRIDDINLPFPRQEMLTQLQESFEGLTVTKERGQQDGPDFPLYSLKDGDEEILFFGMDWEDTLKLNTVYVKQPLVKDEYGLIVGDGYQKIKDSRNGEVKTVTDFHQHTYAYVEGSNIKYVISGDVYLPDTVDFENLKFTEEQIKDWTIEYLIWRE